MADDPRATGGPGGPSGGGSGGALSTKYGPMPAWAWLALAAGVGFIWFYARKSKSSTEDTPVTNTVTTPSADSEDVSGQLATFAAQIRDLQGGQSTVDTSATPAPKNLTYNQLPAVKSQDLKAPHTTGPLKQGDTLESIALRLWGDANGARWLYDVNMEKIEKAAEQAGYPNSQDGTILVPGINLWVPSPLGKTPLDRVSANE